MKGESVRRFHLVFCVALLAAATATSAGIAAKPMRSPVLSGPIDLPAGLVCSFAVHGEVVVNRQILTVFSDGSSRATGEFVAALTNVTTGKTIKLNAPGSVSLSAPDANGVVSFKGTGQNIYFFGPGELGANAPGGLFLLDGLTTYQFDANFSTVPGSVQHHGGVVDLCAALS
ncbi:MAG: hypothetical protein H0X39_13100 [Actinobacteria bacterium]|nr:hypothetical protein [Actinomycetota bacterium]